MTDLADEPLDMLRDSIRIAVAAGYATPEDITEDILQRLADGVTPDLATEVPPQLVESLVAEELDAHRAVQASWPPVTDYDRLAEAFASLTAAGIIARENFACCGTCGVAEIRYEMSKYGDIARGYAFFHSQDTERAVAGQGLFLNFGSTADAESAGVGVATEIMDTLHRHGLTTAWNGRVSTRIFVDLDWKRRRVLAPRG